MRSRYHMTITRAVIGRAGSRTPTGAIASSGSVAAGWAAWWTGLVSGSAAAAAAVELAVELVRTDSVNPGLVPGAAGEAAVAWLLARRLERGGVAVEKVPAAGGTGRPSLVARHAGTGGGRSLLLNVHLDTVGVAAMGGPFAGRLTDGRDGGRVLG